MTPVFNPLNAHRCSLTRKSYCEEAEWGVNLREVCVSKDRQNTMVREVYDALNTEQKALMVALALDLMGDFPTSNEQSVTSDTHRDRRSSASA